MIQMSWVQISARCWAFIYNSVNFHVNISVKFYCIDPRRPGAIKTPESYLMPLCKIEIEDHRCQLCFTGRGLEGFLASLVFLSVGFSQPGKRGISSWKSQNLPEIKKVSEISKAKISKVF